MPAAGLLAGWSYAALFAVDRATMAIYGLVVLLRVPETRARPDRSAASRAAPAGLAQVVADRAFVGFLFFTFLTALVMFQSGAALSAWMAVQGHVPRTYGAVVAVNGVLIVLLQPFAIGWLAS